MRNKRQTFSAPQDSPITLSFAAAQEARAKRQPKVRATLYVSAELLDECRNAAWHLAGPPARLTLTQLVEDALRTELAHLKQQHNQGQPFPPRAEELRGGRPLAA